MIQVYIPGNSNYTKNGDAALLPSDATVSAEINGMWSAYLTHPIDAEGRWKYLTEEAVIKMPSYNGEQLFRITNCTKALDGVTCEMVPIFYDAAHDCFITSARAKKKTGQQALDILCGFSTKYTGVSDITKLATAYYEYVNLLEALASEDENSFVNRWGGEVEFDNLTVRVMSRLGSDSGYELRYGKNITDFSQTVDMTEVITRIYPKGYNGAKLSGSGYVNSPLINRYPTVKAAEMVFDNIRMETDVTDGLDDEDNLIICKTQAEMNAALRAACADQWTAGIDKPKVSIDITDLADLAKIYGGIDESLKLGDTVHLRHSALDIVTDARVVSLTYDSIRDRVQSVVIGEIAYNYMNSISSTVSRVQSAIKSNGTVRAENISGTIDMKKTGLYAQAEPGANVVGILFENNDAESELYGAMAIGTQGFMIADTKDSSGKWEFKTFGTSKGLIADFIQTGRLSSQNGKSFWDLTNSIMKFYDDIFDASVLLDEGYIEFEHEGGVFGKITRILQAGSDVLAVHGSKEANRVTIGQDKIQLFATAASGILSLASAYLQASVGNSYFRIWEDGEFQNIDLNSGGATWARVDGKNDQIWMNTGSLVMNGSTGYSGTVTLGSRSVTIENGIITAIS